MAGSRPGCPGSAPRAAAERPTLFPAGAGAWCGRGCTPVAARGYATGVRGSAAVTATGGVHGFPAELTSFIGRDGPLREVAGLLAEFRLVTVTGPGGAGKTRLGGEGGREGGGEFAGGGPRGGRGAGRGPAAGAGGGGAARGGGGGGGGAGPPAAAAGGGQLRAPARRGRGAVRRAAGGLR